MWFVPARVAGRWRSELGPAGSRLEIEFSQRYQDVSASARLDGAPAQVWEARLESDRLSFVIVAAPGGRDEAGLYFEGRVRGNVIEGTVARGVGRARSAAKWRAERLAR